MFRFAIALFTCVALSGCTGVPQSTSSSTKLNADTKELFDNLIVCLEQKDWESIRALHWSDSKITSATLREIYEQKLERLQGKISLTLDSIDYQRMDSENFDTYVDREELPGSPDILSGRIELELIGDKNTNDNDGIRIFAFLCKEQGKTRIFGYIELE